MKDFVGDSENNINLTFLKFLHAGNSKNMRIILGTVGTGVTVGQCGNSKEHE